jgi:hypothetical protein
MKNPQKILRAVAFTLVLVSAIVSQASNQESHLDFEFPAGTVFVSDSIERLDDGSIEIKAPSVAVLPNGQEIEILTTFQLSNDIEIAAPAVSVMPKSIEIAAPAISLAPKSIEIAAPAISLAPKSIEIAAPAISLAPKSIEVSYWEQK